MKQRSSISIVIAIAVLPALLAPFFASAATNPGTSLNWSGYTATGGTFTAVGARWTIPVATTPASNTIATGGGTLSADATWVGIGGIASTDLIQAGTQTVFQNGSPSYEAWYEILPANSQAVPLTVSPGDAVTVSITQQSDGEWNISFTDNTTGKSYATSIPYQSSLSSADWIEEMPSTTGHNFVALDTFGTAAFTNGFTVENGAQTTLAGANAQSLTMITSGNQALAVPSSLGANGANFSITRTSVAASTAATAGAQGFAIGRGGRWSRTGVGVQGYVPTPTPTITVSNTGGGTEYFRIGFGGGFPATFYRVFRNNFQDGWKNNNLSRDIK